MVDHRRQHWMAILARADCTALATASAALLPVYTILRGPEMGLVMLQGRAGGGGQPFNLGEVSVARCTVRSDDEYVGHAYCLGRDLRRAELAAAIDAALQDSRRHRALYEAVIAPLAAAQEAERELTARRAAATKVQFFTMGTMRT